MRAAWASSGSRTSTPAAAGLPNSRSLHPSGPVRPQPLEVSGAATATQRADHLHQRRAKAALNDPVAAAERRTPRHAPPGQELDKQMRIVAGVTPERSAHVLMTDVLAGGQPIHQRAHEIEWNGLIHGDSVGPPLPRTDAPTREDERDVLP